MAASTNLHPKNTPPIPGTSSARFPAAPAKTPSRGRFSRAPGGDQIRDLRGNYAGGYAINWVGLQVITKELENFAQQGVIKQANVEALAREIQSYAQNTAPWTDDSGNARRGLKAEVQTRPNGEVAIILSHTEEYGVYLENANGGAYAVIIPTLEHYGNEMVSRLFGMGRPQ